MVSILFNGTQIDLSPAVFRDTNGALSYKQVFKTGLSKRDDSDNDKDKEGNDSDNDNDKEGNDYGESLRSAMEEVGEKIAEKRNIMARSKYYKYKYL